jgi:hypothetical protein
LDNFSEVDKRNSINSFTKNLKNHRNDDGPTKTHKTSNHGNDRYQSVDNLILDAVGGSRPKPSFGSPSLGSLHNDKIWSSDRNSSRKDLNPLGSGFGIEPQGPQEILHDQIFISDNSNRNGFRGTSQVRTKGKQVTAKVDTGLRVGGVYPRKLFETSK